MAKGRPNLYYSHVQPRFNEIREWLETGATEKEVAEQLGIHIATFISYKNNFPEFCELIKNSRKRPVQEIKAALLKRARGFYYDETTTVMSDKGIQTTTYHKYSVPDPASAMILLKHWDKDDDGHSKWTQDPAQLELKKEELEFKKQHLEQDLYS